MQEEIKEVEKLMIIKEDLKKYIPILSKASDTILEKQATTYPIFVATKQAISIGIPIIDQQKNQTFWNVSASSLEEFINKKLLLENKVENFKKTFKNPKQFICFFVLSDIGAQFIFLPRA